jgi:hypothetical protein
MTKDRVSIVQLHREHGVRKCIDNASIHRDRIGILAAGTLFSRRSRRPDRPRWPAILWFLGHEAPPV